MALAETDLDGSGRRSLDGQQNGSLDFEQMYRSHAPRIECFVRRFVPPGAVEDIVQETFARAYAARHSIDPQRPAWPWLRTIASRLCMDSFRPSNGGGVLPLDVDGDDDRSGLCDDDPGSLAVDAEHREVVREALGGLSDRYRQLLLLKHVEGLRYDEIAADQGTTPHAARNATWRARRFFRDRYLAAIAERRLGAIVGPFASPLAWLRRGAQRVDAGVGGFVRQLSTVPVELTSQAASQVPALAVAVALLAGAVSPAGAALPASSSEAGPSKAQLARIALRSDSAIRPAPAASARREPANSPDGSHEAPAASESPDDDSPSVGGLDRFSAPSPSIEPPKEERNVSAPPPPRKAQEIEEVSEADSRTRFPDEVRATSFAFSPRSDEDGVVFASGGHTGCLHCGSHLFRSDDLGATWVKLSAEGFDGKRLLLPPAYGDGDDRIFAMSDDGVLQVSADGGESFGPAAEGAPLQGGAMAISPDFNTGDPRILIGARSGLYEYNDDSRTIAPAGYSAQPGSLEPAFASRELVLVGGRMMSAERKWGSALYRCEGTVCSGTRFTDLSRTPGIRLAPDFLDSGRMYAFVGPHVFVSDDGGETVAELPVPWSELDVVDLAVAEDGRTLVAGLWSVVDEQNVGALYVSRDAGESWERVNHPPFDEGAVVVKTAGSRVLVGLKGSGLSCSPDLGRTWSKRC